MTREKVAVLGAGAWGVALANVAAQGRTQVALWGRDPQHVEALARDRENKRHLPGLALNPAVQPTNDLYCLREAKIVLAVTPAQAMRTVVRMARPYIAASATFVVCAKGIERGDRKFMSEVVVEEAPNVAVAVLSGPSFAADVCRGLPTAVTLAAADDGLAQHLCEQISARLFRLYRTTDVRGVEIGGAAKNVLAIAAGMAAGRELGASAQAALIARGFAELTRLGRALGARQETLMGLSGLGDLVLTCGSAQSRNFSLGQGLGAGKTLVEATQDKLAEGAFTARVLVEMAQDLGVDMPISQSVDAIIAGRLSVDAAIDGLLMRPLRAES
jgi:glycerol-3-phosphate dehydrogenase (NAD(P)+)